MSVPLVIVESPAKARTIEKFLGGRYRVEASIGHVRDLPRSAAEIPLTKKKEPWARLGVNVEQHFEPLYIVPNEKKAQVAKLKEALADASALYLATDEDREGESISWHLLEVLKPKVPVHRLVFHEITREAIDKALAKPRKLDENLVRAQETRRIVDRLFGYEVSPLLWRKVKPQLSAGRVQSVAVRLVVERERQRMAFRSAMWWDVTGIFNGDKGKLEATLLTWAGQRIATGKDFDDLGKLREKAAVLVLDKAAADNVVRAVSGKAGTISQVEEKPYTDRPAPPFTTSTLQQEANRKLRWTSKRAMQVAQKLYETGWITYMRTDSTTLSEEALAAARSLIRDQYGADYLPAKPRVYTTKVKNAQEAHEAIRPSGTSFRGIEEAERQLDADEARLYALIWKRTVACQMADSRGKLVAMTVAVDQAEFQARGKTIEFAGFRRAYVEGSDNPEAELADPERILPSFRKGDAVSGEALTARPHETQPPARLTEATLVKELEARGIGRPSTYASIIETILQRGYVFKKGTALVPTFTAFAVTKLLEQHLTWLVDYDFTARMEEQLDEVALGKEDSERCLARFYLGGAGLRERLGSADGQIDPREVCTLSIGTTAEGTPIDVRVGRYGPFLSSGELKADIPGDLAPDELSIEKAEALLADRKEGPRVLGVDPETEQNVFLMNGRFGPYIQLGEITDPKKKEKPPRAGLLKGMKIEEIDLDLARALLSLPRTVGQHPETSEPIVAANGRFGPYIKCGDATRSVPDSLSILSLTEEDALELLKKPATRRGAATSAGRPIGPDPKTQRTITLREGRFGPYVTDGETNATLPRGSSPDALTLEDAIELIRSREGAPKKVKPGRKPPAAKAAAPEKKPAAAKKAKAAPVVEAEAPAPAKKPAAAKKAKAAPAEPAPEAAAPPKKKPAAKKKA